MKRSCRRSGRDSYWESKGQEYKPIPHGTQGPGYSHGGGGPFKGKQEVNEAASKGKSKMRKLQRWLEFLPGRVGCGQHLDLNSNPGTTNHSRPGMCRPEWRIFFSSRASGSGVHEGKGPVGVSGFWSEGTSQERDYKTHNDAGNLFAAARAECASI